MKQQFWQGLCFLIFACANLSCTDVGNSPVSAGNQDPQTRWRGNNIHTYVLYQQRQCFCADAQTQYALNIVNDVLVGMYKTSDNSPVPQGQWGMFMTIDQLFELIKSTTPGSVASMRVDYDPRYGYPVSIFIDPSKNIADEEFGYSSRLSLPIFF